MKQTLKLGAPLKPAARSAGTAASARQSIEISLGSAEGLRIVRRRQPDILWRKAAPVDSAIV